MTDLERFVAQVFWAAVARQLRGLAGVKVQSFEQIHRHSLLIEARFSISHDRERWARMMGPETCQACGAPQ